MASYTSILSVLLLIVSISSSAGPALAHRSQAQAYIESQCKATLYQTLCVQYLSLYANSTSIQSPRQLTQIALSVSLYRAHTTRTYMLKVARELKSTNTKDYQAVKDCLDQIDGCADQLGQSIRELRRMDTPQATASRNNVFWHISNVNTWVSAALTDASTCVDQFPGSRMSILKATIKAKVLNVAQTTSNALALFHTYAAKYKP